ncbi:MAG: hypothetical protein ACREJB_14825 [Planctomycetaceae bacterium]
MRDGAPRRPRPEPAGNAGTLIALLGLLLIGGGLIALAALVIGGAVAGLFLVVFGLLFLGVFHYVTWGWWLSRLPDEDEDEER